MHILFVVLLGILVLLGIVLIILKISGKFYIITDLVYRFNSCVLKKRKKKYFNKVYNKDVVPMLDRNEKYERWNKDINNHEKQEGFKKKLCDKFKKIKAKSGIKTDSLFYRERLHKHRENYEGYLKFCNKHGFELSEEEREYYDKFNRTDYLLANESEQLRIDLMDREKEYNIEYSIVCNSAKTLFNLRVEADSTIKKIKELTDSISNHPIEFDREFEEITIQLIEFKSSLEFGNEEEKEFKNLIKKVAGGSVAGLVVAGPWIVSLFGKDEIQNSIESLEVSDINNSNYDLNNTIPSGDNSIENDKNISIENVAKIAIATASIFVLGSIIRYIDKTKKYKDDLRNEICKVIGNIKSLLEVKEKIAELISKTETQNEKLDEYFNNHSYLKDYKYEDLEDEQKSELFTIVKNTNILSKLINEKI